MHTMKTDRERAGLRGPVRTCMELHGDGAEPNCGDEYALDGRLLLSHTRASPGSRVETIYSYDDAGRLTTVVGPHYRDQIQYDEQGRKTRVRTVPPRPERQRIATSVDVIIEVMEEGRQLVGGGTITTCYNQNDQPLESLVRDAQGEVLARIVHEYDAEGRLVRDSLVQESFELPELMIPEEHRAELRQMLRTRMKDLPDRLGWPNNAERTYVYDQQGQLTEWHLNVGAFRNDTTLSYNEHGDVVRWVTLQSGTPLPERVSPSDWSHELKHGYQYDEHDNWIEQKTRTLVKAGETSNKESVLRRVLTYY
jgi:YD repeat-containing protein